MRHTGGGERLADQVAERSGRTVELGVDLVRAAPQRGQAGGDGDRVPGQRAGLVDRPDRRELGHHVGPAAERRRREAAAHHLAEGEQVGPAALDAVPAGRGENRKPVITSSEISSAPYAGTGRAAAR